MPEQPEADEEWRAVVGREGEYEVSSLGRVRSHYRGGRILTPWRNDARGKARRGRTVPDDYDRVEFAGGEKAYVNVLVCEAFHGERPDDHPTEGPYYACHQDGDRHRNHADNLYWGTATQNVRDAQAHGTYRAPVRRRDRQTGDLFAGSGGEVACG